MNRYVPFQSSYDIAKGRDKVQTWLLFAATVLALGSLYLSSVKSSDNFPYTTVNKWVNVLASVCAVLYLIWELLVNDKFYNSTKEKHLDLIDKAFDKNIAGQQSTGYFNAQGIPPGTYRLAVMTFENTLFTCAIAKRMTLNKWISVFVVGLIFVTSASLGEQALVNSIIQLAATGVLLQQAIRLQLFANRMSAIHADFKLMFNDLKDLQDKSTREWDMIRNVLNYESTHSWGCVLLDSKVFTKLNPELSKKWEELKNLYNIR